MLFHFVHSLGFASQASFSTINDFAVPQQPIRIFEISGYWSCHGEQNTGYHVKEPKKLGQKQESKVTLYSFWGHLSKKQIPSSDTSWNDVTDLPFSFSSNNCDQTN